MADNFNENDNRGIKRPADNDENVYENSALRDDAELKRLKQSSADFNTSSGTI